ncbi:hypothetical protein HYU07_02200 [Candidatus Woesearchaeota archaeon]|nr:hypothetical protein [Candidatus Woesearchaeota archaeon]
MVYLTFIPEKTLDATYCYHEDDRQLCFEKLDRLEKLCFDVPYKTDCIKK